MKLNKNDHLVKMYRESWKVDMDEISLKDKSESTDGSTKYYFDVGEHYITLNIYKKENLLPLVKEFSCSCKHSSLFGTKENIPCKHILRLIVWLDTYLKEV